MKPLRKRLKQNDRGNMAVKKRSKVFTVLNTVHGAEEKWRQTLGIYVYGARYIADGTNDEKKLLKLRVEICQGQELKFKKTLLSTEQL